MEELIGEESAILSIDLAVKSYSDFGFALLRKDRGKISTSFFRAGQIGLSGAPIPDELAKKLASFCRNENIGVLVIDGPQGWKKPDSALPFRRADFEAKAPAKVCEREVVKPATYLSFVKFSTKLFFLLASDESFELFSDTKPMCISSRSTRILLCESLPYATWKLLGEKPLPRKKKCSEAEIATRYLGVCRKFSLKKANKILSHDELQALVGALAGIHILEGRVQNLLLFGERPKLSKDCIFEGFILCTRSGSKVVS